MSEINLSKAVRSNLLSLQNTANLMAKTQGRLATGLKVNSALDNPTNFFTASSLNSRAGDINQLLDSMANGIQTLEAADNGLSAITKTLESMQSTLRQARQDKSFQTSTFEVDSSLNSGNISFAGGSIGDTAVEIALVSDVNTAAAATTASTATDLELTTTLDALGFDDGETIIIGNGTGTDTYTFTATDAETATIGDLISGLNADTDVNVTAALVNGQLVLTADDNETEITVGGTGAIAGLAAQDAPDEVFAAKTTRVQTQSGC